MRNLFMPSGSDLRRAAAAKKAWQSRKRGGPGVQQLKAAARAAGAVVAAKPISMGMTMQGWAHQSRRTRRAAKLLPYIRSSRAANVNALRIRKGRQALVFKNQMSPSAFAAKGRAVRRRVREQALRDAGLVKVRGARGGIYWE